MSTGGRGVWNRKTRVDEARSIDVLDLQRKGVFCKGPTWSWTASWSQNSEVVASISYRVEFGDNDPIGLRFMYTITENDTCEKKEYNYITPVVSTPCHFGGRRWWFICPLSLNGRACRRRCRIVYLPSDAGYFGCRECYQLTYESRQRHREAFYEGFEKPYMAAKAVREALAKTRSWEKKDLLWRKLFRANDTLKRFERIHTSREPKIIYKGK